MKINKTLMLAVAAIVLGMGVGMAEAVSGYLANGVNYDTAATALTVVYRDSNGAITLGSNDVVTAKIAANVVDTSKLNFVALSNVSSGKIVCIMGGNLQQFGVCTGGVTAGACTCG